MTSADRATPWKFYGLTETGREFLNDHNLLAVEETFQQIYNNISDKPREDGQNTRTPPPERRISVYIVSSVAAH